MAIYAGFDLGASQLKYGLINSQGKILFHSSAPTPPLIEELIRLLKKCWINLKQQSKSKITCCGFGFPGIFSLRAQKIINSPNYPQLNGFALQPALYQFIDVPYWINNDANLAALAEFKLGAGQGTKSMILLTIGTGVGTGLILEGKLWQGKCGFGGELGHAPVNPSGERCPCGSYGCLETEVSAAKIIKNYKSIRNINYKITAEEVYKRAKRGDQTAL
ncbi:MAG: ROK family protein, partial [Candidatus Aminicenantales bacterium]